MEFKIGDVLNGKVTAITKFGAFVAIGDGVSGMVHISEVAGQYIADINDFLNVGQEINVKIISNNNGKLGLSIKQATPAIVPEEVVSKSDAPVNDVFEAKLKQFMQISDSKLTDLRRHNDKRGGGGRRRM